MFALEPVGVKHNHYESRSAIVCSLAQTPRHLSEELKVGSDALCVFQEWVPICWGWHKLQHCGLLTVVARGPVWQWYWSPWSTAESSAPWSANFCAGPWNWACITSWKTMSFPFFFSPECPLHGQTIIAPSLHLPLISCPCAQCFFLPDRLNLAVCTVKTSAFW